MIKPKYPKFEYQTCQARGCNKRGTLIYKVIYLCEEHWKEKMKEENHLTL